MQAAETGGGRLTTTAALPPLGAGDAHAQQPLPAWSRPPPCVPTRYQLAKRLALRFALLSPARPATGAGSQRTALVPFCQVDHHQLADGLAWSTAADRVLPMTPANNLPVLSFDNLNNFVAELAGMLSDPDAWVGDMVNHLLAFLHNSALSDLEAHRSEIVQACTTLVLAGNSELVARALAYLRRGAAHLVKLTESQAVLTGLFWASMERSMEPGVGTRALAGLS